MNIIEVLRFIFSDLLQGKKRVFIILTLGLLLISGASFITPILMGDVVDAIVNAKRDDFYRITLALLTIYCIKYFLSVIVKKRFTILSQNTSESLQKRMVTKAMNLELNYYDQYDKGYLLSRINEGNTVTGIFSPNVINIFTGFIELTLAIIAMLKLSLGMSFIALALIPVYYFVIQYSTKQINRYTKQCMESSGILSGETYDILNQIEEIKIMNCYEQQMEHFIPSLKVVKSNQIKQGKSMIYYLENTQFLSSLSSLLILIMSGIMIFKGEFTLGLYTTFAAYSNKVFSNVQSIASIGITLNPILVSMERVKEFLGLSEENEGEAKKAVQEITQIDVVNISFSYPTKNEKLIIEKCNLSFKTDEKIWMTGRNGVGKSTIMKLLLGLYQTKEGEIKINGIPIGKIDIYELRNQLSVVSQNPILFKGTVEENILNGLKEQHKEALYNLIERYNLQENLSTFTEGLSTMVSHGGANLSGGQKQFIAFLRAIIAKRPLLMLDEPTSSMDINLKEKIIHMLLEEQVSKMILLISHDNYLIDSSLTNSFKVIPLEECCEIND